MTSRVLIAMLASLTAAPALAASDATLFGLWARGDGKAKVKVERCGDNICATNTWVREGTKGEKAGDILVMSVRPDDSGGWSGTAFDRQRDLTYRMTLKVGETRMISEGCVLAGVICKEMAWTRLASE